MLRLTLLVVVLAVLAAGAWVGVALTHSAPAPKLSLALDPVHTAPGTPLRLNPPTGVQEAVALDGVGVMAAGGAEQPNPIASLTKMMSVLVILHDHPLGQNQSGPAITVTPADVSTYQSDRRQGDSVVAVTAGEQLSELQALEGALIPSGDNLIEMLADWDAGSVPAFVAKMNAMAHLLGLSHTHYTGPSGVNPGSVSTAEDQLKVAEVAMRIPVFATIVSMAQATLPVAGVVYNVNSDLGTDGIDGIKTGWVPQGGASFVFSAPEKVDGHEVRLIGDVIGERGGSPLPTALTEAEHLLTSAASQLRVVRLAAGLPVATVSVPYGSSVGVVSSSPVQLIAWNGASLRLSVKAPSTLSGGLPAGSRVGTLTVSLGTTRVMTDLRTTGRLATASLSWRLEHP